MPTIIHIDNNAINLEQLTYCSFENNMATFHFTNSKSLSVRCSEKEFEDVLDNSIKTVVPVKSTYAVLQDSETGKKIIAPVSCAVVTHFDNVYYMLPSGEGERSSAGRRSVGRGAWPLGSAYPRWGPGFYPDR